MIGKAIIFSEHALEQLKYRGTTKEEVVEAINSCSWAPAELGRLDCRKDFPFNKTWNDKVYKTKQVRPIFADEKMGVVVVTVYVYYF